MTNKNLYTPLSREHFKTLRVYPQMVPPDAITGEHLDGGKEGTVWTTTAELIIPPVSDLLKDVKAIAHTHWSATRPEAVQGILMLINSVIIPTAISMISDLISTECYSSSNISILDLEYAGLEGENIIARLEIKPIVDDAPNIPLNISFSAPTEIMAAINQMIDVFMIPAIKAEIGVR
jgi:hypothetical protein